jgi:predicted O-methyltransferase YrrM
MAETYRELLLLGDDPGKYEKNRRFFKDKNGNNVHPPAPHKESISNFLHRMGYPESKLEGHLTDEYFEAYAKLFDKMITRPIKKVIEIGFNAGHSADYFLSLGDKTTVISFDLMIHPYSYYAKTYIDLKYPKKHILIAGNSNVTVPSFYSEGCDSSPADIILIDGDHRYDPAYADMINLKQFADKNTVVIVDNIAPHLGCGRQVYYAYRRAIDNGIFLNQLHHEAGKDYKDGWSVAYYNFPGTKQKSKPMDYAKMERKVKVSILGRKISKARTMADISKIDKDIKNLEQDKDSVTDAELYSYYDSKKRKIMKLLFSVFNLCVDIVNSSYVKDNNFDNKVLDKLDRITRVLQNQGIPLNESPGVYIQLAGSKTCYTLYHSRVKVMQKADCKDWEKTMKRDLTCDLCESAYAEFDKYKTRNTPVIVKHYWKITTTDGSRAKVAIHSIIQYTKSKNGIGLLIGMPYAPI